jgi:hypothetical protein
MPVTVGEVAHATYFVLKNCVAIYKAYKSAGKDASEVAEELDVAILCIRNIAKILFEWGYIDVLDDANAERVFGILKRLETILQDCSKFEIPVDQPSLPQNADSVKSFGLVIAKSASNSEIHKAITAALETEQGEFEIYEPKFGIWKRLRWIFIEQKKMIEFKDKIQKWVKNLKESLPPIVLLTAGADLGKLELISTPGSLTYFDRLTNSARRLTHRIKRSPIPIPSIPATDLLPQQPSSPHFQTAAETVIYKKELVWAESKYYRPASEDKAMKNIAELGGFLKDAGSVNDQNGYPELNVLECLGSTHEQKHFRFRLLFRLPSRNGLQARPLTLFDVLRNSRPVAQSTRTLTTDSKVPKPGLDQRFALVQTLAETIARLHNENWLHKSIRGDNIMFLHFSNRKDIDFGRPFLVGFQESRPVDGVTSSPALGEEQWIHNLYRHPERQGVPTDTFQKQHDYYAFGATLVEIGYWAPLITLGKFATFYSWYSIPKDKRPHTDQLEWTPTRNHGMASKDELIALGESPDFRERVGKIWSEVALICLKCDFGIDNASDDNLQRKLQGAFKEKVVDRLFTLKA